MKLLIKGHALTEVLQRFGVNPKTAVQNMHEMYLTGTKQRNDGLMIGVFGACVFQQRLQLKCLKLKMPKL